MRILFICCLIWPLLSAQCNEKVFIHRIQGDAFVDYVNEELSVDNQGVVEYKTLSPFPRLIAPNIIGEFRKQLSQDEQTNLKKKLDSYRSQLDKANFKAIELKSSNAGELREEIWIGKRGLFGIEHFQSLAGLYHDLRQHFFELKKEVLKQPYRALSLNCEPPANKHSSIDCSYHNIGQQVVQTIDPASMEGALRCINLNKNEIQLNQGKIGDPRKLKPAIIEIATGQKFSFTIKANAECEVAVSVKTTDMLINPRYQDLLLGHWYSNYIAPEKNPLQASP